MAETGDIAEYRRLYSGLVANPAAEIRKEAVLKRAELADLVGRSEGEQGRERGAAELREVDRYIRWGDELRGLTNIKERQERRRLYARAYLRARDAQRAVLQGELG